ncbi:hypothetical protein SDC9_51267 [bioreactor metagenome]|uniref:Uncharacterized protein n=1 Tax=bioreactor metagenome TaxID=1076179 RepID=A0A644WM52_9ZZZZ
MVPGGEGVCQIDPGLGQEELGRQQRRIERRGDRRPVETGADEHQFLTPVAPGLDPVPRDLGAGLGMGGAALARQRGPPQAERAHRRGGTGKRELRRPVRPRRDPEMPLRPDHPGQIAGQHRMDAARVEGQAGAVDEGGNAVFLGLRHMLGKAVKLLRPKRMLGRGVEVEAPGVQDLVGRDDAEIGLDQLRVGVQRADDFARRIEPCGAGIADLVQHHHIGEFDLLGEQVDKRARVARAQAFAAVGDEIGAGKVARQVDRIDHRHHGVEPGDVGQAFARLVAEVEGGGDGQGLGDAGALDQQIVETPFLGEMAHTLQQVVAQGAADAAVRHFDQLLLGAVERGAVAHQIGVDVHLGHVIDDDRDAPAVAVVQNVVQQRGLAGTEKARKHGDGKAGVVGGAGHAEPHECYDITYLSRAGRRRNPALEGRGAFPRRVSAARPFAR